MARTFYYGTDAELAEGAPRFSSGISATPGALGVLASEATAYAALNATFQTKYAASKDPATRTRGSIAAKNAARLPLRQLTGQLAGKIIRTAAVTDEQLIALGLSPRVTPTPVPIPTAVPVVDVIKTLGNTLTVSVHQQDVLKRGKPAGVYGVQLYSFVGETPPSDINLWRLEGAATRTRFQVQFPSTLPAFTKVWMTALYTNPRLQAGPASTPRSWNLGTWLVQDSAATTGDLKLAA